MSRPFEATVLVRSQPPISPTEARRLLRALARRLKVPHDSVAVVFADDEMVRGLNRKYRGQDQATDVLSFPASGEGAEVGEQDERHLGDIVVSSETARRQARSRRRGAGQEARILLIHGFLHLLGYDHEADDGEMEALERTLRQEMIHP